MLNGDEKFASAVFDFAIGVMITHPALIIQREFPTAAFGMLSGLTLAIIQTGTGFGPSLLGWLRDATGSYTVPIMTCMSCRHGRSGICGLRRAAMGWALWCSVSAS